MQRNKLISIPMESLLWSIQWLSTISYFRFHRHPSLNLRLHAQQKWFLPTPNSTNLPWNKITQTRNRRDRLQPDSKSILCVVYLPSMLSALLRCPARAARNVLKASEQFPERAQLKVKESLLPWVSEWGDSLICISSCNSILRVQLSSSDPSYTASSMLTALHEVLYTVEFITQLPGRRWTKGQTWVCNSSYRLVQNYDYCHLSFHCHLLSKTVLTTNRITYLQQIAMKGVHTALLWNLESSMKSGTASKAHCSSSSIYIQTIVAWVAAFRRGEGGVLYITSRR